MSRFNLADHITDSEVEFLCELITPKEIKYYFQKNPTEYEKLKPAFRAKKLDDQKAINLIVKNRSEPFVSKFLYSFIEKYYKDVKAQIVLFQETGATADAAMIQALAGSEFFSNNTELYFKFEDSTVSDKYVSLIKEASVLLHEKTVETSDKHSLNEKLTDSLENIKRDLSKEREKYAYVQDRNNEIQQELELAQNELSEANTQITQMQTEIKRLQRLEKYADISQESESAEAYTYASLCRVIGYSSNGQVQLERLADVHDGKLTLFQVDSRLPNRFENRDILFGKDGPTDIKSFGIWRWKAVPNRDNPERDYVYSAFDGGLQPVNIFVISGCTRQEEIVKYLSAGISVEKLGAKTLVAMPQINNIYTGLLCTIDQFNIQDGIARIKPSVLRLPFFQVHVSNTLVLGGITGKRFCRSLNLGFPSETMKIKPPLAWVKEIILRRTDIDALIRQDFNENEALHCLKYLRALETSTLYDEIAESCDCSIEEAQSYVKEFIETTAKSFSGFDIDTEVLSAIIERNSKLTAKCKDMLYNEWFTENEQQLSEARQVLEDVQQETEQQRLKAAALEREQNDLRQQIDECKAELAQKEALAAAVEQKVAERIAEARKNAADFISELAFTAPIALPKNENRKNSFSVLNRSVKVNETSETVTDIFDFEDNLADNLECCGYSVERSAMLAQILAFCIGQCMPIVCDSNSEVIADCLSATLGVNAVTMIHLTAGEPCCCELYELLGQDTGKAPSRVCLVSGALDAYSPNVFNGILQSINNVNDCILVLSCEGTPPETLPSSVWNRTIFIDGDIDLVNLPKGNLKAFETKVDFRQEIDLNVLKKKQKQLKPFTQFISNRALLNYACYLAFTNETPQSDTCVLSQILLTAKADGKIEQVLQLFADNEIDVEKLGIAKYL